MPLGGAGYIGVEKETTWGTPVAVGSGQFAFALSESLTLAIDRFEKQNIVGTRAAPDDVAGLRRNEGEILFPAYPEIIGKILKGVSNSGSISVVLSGFLWTTRFFTPTADASSLTPYPSYTIEAFLDVTSANRYAGAVFARAAFSVQPNQALQVAVPVIAKTTSVIAKSTPTYPGSPTDPFTFDTVSIGIAGAGTPFIQALTWVIDGQVEGVPSLNNTNEIAFMRNRGPQMVTLNGTIELANLTEFNNFVTQAEQRITVSLFKASSFQLTFDFPRCQFTEFPLAMPGRERLTVAFAMKALYHTGSATQWESALTTTRSNF